MNERIKELAEQAGIRFTPDWGECYTGNVQIERFAELIRADEREACAKLCETIGVHPALNVYNGGPEWYQRQKKCAAAIRARSNHESLFDN
jgi:hypothetical protein